MSASLRESLERNSLADEPKRLGGAEPSRSQFTKAAKPPRVSGPPESAQHFLGLYDHELPTEQLAIGRQTSPITDAAALGLSADSLLVDE